MKRRVQDQVEELARMGVRELQQRRRELFGDKPEPAHRRFLSRKIAWRLQADDEGGLPESARELARAIARDAPLRTRVVTNAKKRRAGVPVEQTATTINLVSTDPVIRLPSPGSECRP